MQKDDQTLFYEVSSDTLVFYTRYTMHEIRHENLHDKPFYRNIAILFIMKDKGKSNDRKRDGRQISCTFLRWFVIRILIHLIKNANVRVTLLPGTCVALTFFHISVISAMIHVFCKKKKKEGKIYLPNWKYCINKLVQKLSLSFDR